MASPEADSRLSQVVSPALEKIIKIQERFLAQAIQARPRLQVRPRVEKLASPSKPEAEAEPNSSGPGPLHDGGTTEYSLADSESIISPLINAANSGVLKIADPAVDCIQKLIAYGYLRGEADPSGGDEAKLLSKLIESVCKGAVGGCGARSGG